MAFNLDTAEPAPVPQMLNLDTATRDMISVSGPTATYRANRIQFGQSLPNVGYPETYDGLIRGQEQQLREQAASNVDLQRTIQRQNFVHALGQTAGADISSEQARMIAARFQTLGNPTDPNSVFEESFARQVVQGIRDQQRQMPGSILDDADQEMPGITHQLMLRGTATVAKRELVLTRAQNAQDAVDTQSTIGHIADEAKTWLPFYSVFKLSGNVRGTNLLTGGLTGENLEAQAVALYRLPFEEFKTEFNRIMDGLQRDNPALAVRFANAMLGQSTLDRMMANAMPVLDATMFAGTGTLAKTAIRRATLANETNQVVKDVAAQLGNARTRADLNMAIAEGTGNVKDAAVKKATNNFINEMEGRPDILNRSVDDLAGVYRLRSAEIVDKPGPLSRDGVIRLERDSNRFWDVMVDFIRNKIVAERIPALVATEAGQKAVQDLARRDFAGLQNAVKDVRGPYKIEGGTGYYTVVDIAHIDGSLFRDKAMAENFKANKGLLGAVIEPQKSTSHQVGMGYVLRLAHPVNETDPIIRQMLLSTTQSQGSSWSTAFAHWLGKIRTSEDVLSLDHSMNRKLAIYGQSNLAKIFKDEVKLIDAIKPGLKDRFVGDARQQWREWRSVVKFAEDDYHPVTGEKGYFFRSPTEIRDHYQRFFSRDPSEKEIAAYFANVRLHEAQNLLENLGMVRDKLRKGVQLHSYYVTQPNGQRLHSPFFEGTVEPNLPSGKVSILVVRSTPEGLKEEVHLGDRFFNATIKSALEKDIADNSMKVIRLEQGRDRPLEGFSPLAGNRKMDYVVIPSGNSEVKQISWNQVPFRGPKVDYIYDLYVGQARITSETFGTKTKPVDLHSYEGDTNIFGTMSPKQARELSGHWDSIRALLEAKNYPAAIRYSNTHMDMPWEEVRGWFYQSKDALGRNVPARLSLKEPIRVIPRDSLSIDIDNSLFSRYKDLRDATKRYGDKPESRDLYDVRGIRDVGTRGNPLYQVAPAETVDTSVSLNRSLTRMIHSTFMDDYKIFAVEHWIQEAKGLLKTVSTNPEQEIRNAPYKFFNKPDWLPTADKALVQKLETARFQIQQFMGVPSKTDTMLHEVAQKLSDTIYGAVGPRALRAPADASFFERATRIEPYWRLFTINDAASAIRTLTFHAKLGLFAVPQLLVQSQTYANIYAIAGPRRAAEGSVGALLTIYSRAANRTPALMDKLDDIASRMGWRLGEFRESLETAERVGFFNVGREHMFLDTHMSGNFFTSGKDKFLNWGDWFFRAGESNVRYGAWHTAFRDFRELHPTGRLTENNIAEVLQKADLYSGNMSRASASMLQHGAFSVTSQFLSYQARLTEQMFSKRLTIEQKGRMILAYAGLYGVPTAVGLTGFPGGDLIRETARSQGYVVGSNWVETAMYEGIPSLMLSVATGHVYNVGDRFGSKGFETLREAFRGDKPWWTIMGGAAFSTLSGTWERSDPFLRSMGGILRGDNSTFPVSIHDLVDVFKESTTVSAADRMISAMNTGRWLSRNGTSMSDVDISAANAIFMTATGLQPQKVADTASVAHTLKDQEAKEKRAENTFIREWRRAVQAGIDNNPEQYIKFMTRANAELTLANYPIDKRGTLLARAAAEHQSLVERLGDNFHLRHVPVGQEQSRQEQFRRIYEQRQRERGAQP